MRKTLSLALALLMVISLTGCGGGSPSATDAPQTAEVATDPTPNPTVEPSPSPTPQPTPEPTPEPAPPATLTYGDTFEFDGFEITFINELKWAVVSNRFSEHNESDVCGITVIIKNIGSETSSLSTFECTLFGSKGTQLDKVSSYFNDDVFKIGDMRSGAEGSGYMHFLYDGDGDYYVEFGSRNNKIEVKLPVVK